MAFIDNIKEITPAIADIKNNTPVLIVDDKVLVGGIGGNFIPTGQGGGGSASMDFYKCSAVYSDSTWSGYKAVQASDTKIYSYQSTLTSDPLIYYPEMSIPIANKVYTADALCCIDLYDQNKAAQKDLGQDLVFYAPLTQQSGVRAVVGTDQTPTTTGIISFNNIQGISGLYSSGNQSVQYAGPLDYISGPYTVSLWMYPTQAYSIWYSVCSIFSNKPGIHFYLGNTPCINPPFAKFSETSIDNSWHNLIFTYNSGSIKLYLDGVQTASASQNYDTTSNKSVIIGSCFGETGKPGYITHLRIYNTVLSDQKIQKLVNQLHPTSN